MITCDTDTWNMFSHVKISDTYDGELCISVRVTAEKSVHTLLLLYQPSLTFKKNLCNPFEKDK